MSIGIAFQPFWRWLLIGLVSLAVALALTIPAMHVDLSNNPMILTAAYTQFPGRPGAVFQYRETNEGSDIEISLEPDGPTASAQWVIFLGYVESCSGKRKGSSVQLQAKQIEPKPVFDTQKFDSAFAVNVPADMDQDGSIVCHLNVRPLRATYSERRVAFARSLDASALLSGNSWHQTSNDEYVFNQRNASNLKVEHATDASGNSMHIENSFIADSGSDFNPVTMDWTDVSAERLHEFIYFIAAALIGLSLSCLLEVFRPWLSGDKKTGT